MIWESVVLINLVEMIEISIAFAKHVLNLFCFLSSFWLEDCWKGEMWKEVWNLLVRNIWWISRKMNEKWYFSHLPNCMKLLAVGLAEWLKLVAIKQTTMISTTAELDFLFLLSASERNAVFSSFHPKLLAFLEWLFREQEHLNVKMEMKWKSTCCLQVGSEEKRIFSIMNVAFSEIWNV